MRPHDRTRDRAMHRLPLWAKALIEELRQEVAACHECNAALRRQLAEATDRPVYDTHGALVGARDEEE